MADRKRITCPETARPAEIELEQTPLGVVITSCSHFVPRCAVACTRDCAVRIDNRGRTDSDAERVLVVYAGNDPRTCSLAHGLAEQLARDGFIVERADATVGKPPPPQDYDAIVIGARTGLGGCPRPIAAYLREHKQTLVEMPAFFFTVREPSLLDSLVSAEERIQRLGLATGWFPTEWTIFPSARPAGIPQGSEAHAFALRIAELVPAEAST